MGRISITDFIPPIVPKAIRYFDRTLGAPKGLLHPFDQVPLTDANLILDVGANIGEVTLAALKSFPRCRVICFEPVNSTHEILKRRTAPFSERVTIYKEALSSTKGEAEINITNFHGANSIQTQSQMHSTLNPHIHEVGKEKISLVRLDDIASRFAGEKVDIMKIDVEGHESEVIAGGKNFIQNNVDTIIVEASLMRDLSWERQSVVDVFLLLSELGFRLINVFDLHKSNESKLMCVQMDCVFRHKSKLMTAADSEGKSSNDSSKAEL